MDKQPLAYGYMARDSAVSMMQLSFDSALRVTLPGPVSAMSMTPLSLKEIMILLTWRAVEASIFVEYFRV
jgi:hypothetical protein